MTEPRPQPAFDPEFAAGVWRGYLESPPRIRVAARSVVRRPSDGKYLAVRSLDEVKQEVFYGIPGGGVNFGERAEAGARRELREEFGLEITGLRRIGVIDNHFVHRGVPGHEIVLVFTGTITDDRGLFALAEIPLVDGNEHLAATWMTLDEFRSAARPDLPPLYPDGLRELLLSAEGDRP